MKDYQRILKFLYENDDVDFIDVTNAFTTGKLPSKDRIKQILNDFKDFIETEYNYYGIGPISLDDDVIIPETQIPKVRITQAGRDYYNEQRSKKISITINKRNFLLGFFGILLAIFTFYFTIIKPINNSSIKKIPNNESNFPNPVVCLENKTNDTIYFYPIQTFIVWFPATATGNVYNLSGKYEFNYDSSQISNKLLYIAPNTNLNLSINILNKEKFYHYYKQNENELMIWLRTKPYHLYSSSNLPFNEKWMSKYCLSLNIENK